MTEGTTDRSTGGNTAGNDERSIRDVLLRQPFAILGAVAMFSFLHALLVFFTASGTGEPDIWINPFQAVTRPFWDALPGGLFELPDRALSGMVKDYLTAAAVFSGMWFWHGVTVLRFRLAAVPFALLYGAAWPLVLLLLLPSLDWPFAAIALLLLSREEPVDRGPGLTLFRDVFIWLMILGAAACVLLWFGG